MGKYRKFLCFIIVGLSFCFVRQVNAEDFKPFNTYFQIQSKSLNTTSNIWFAANQTLYLYINSDTVLGDISLLPDYGFAQICSSSKLDVGAFFSDYYDDVNFYPSEQSCQIYGNDAYDETAKIFYITYKNKSETSYSCSVNGTSCYLKTNTSIAFYTRNAYVFTLMTYGWSDEPFVYDGNTDALFAQNAIIIDKNDTMISQNETIISQNTQIINEINASANLQHKTNDLLEDSISKQQDIIDKNNTMISQNKQIINEINASANVQHETNDILENSDTSDATDEAGSFFSGFESDTFGLTSIITAPLNLIQSITSSTCSTMGIPVPFVENTTLELPCLRGIYEKHFGSFLDIYQTITFGIVAYWVCVRIFALVKDFKNPDHDEIEVMDL